MSGISPACHDLDLFFDGELAESAAATYREHLAGCARCKAMLRGRVLEAVAVSKAAAAPAIPLRKPAKKRWVWAGAGVAALVAACVALWLHKPPHHAAMAPQPSIASNVVALEFKLNDERGVDVRFSSAMFDRHRPERSVMRSGPVENQWIRAAELSLETDKLAALEQRDANGFVAALALEGSLKKAVSRAEKLPNSAASFADRAALALLENGDDKQAQANAEHALSLARQALRLDAKHPQAMWNEAVALERLHLSLAAASVLEAIAERDEPGWSTEAKNRAGALRAAHQADNELQNELQGAAIAMIHGGAPMTDVLVARHASFARLAFHLAVASTADPARLAALTSVAEQLDLAKDLARVRTSNLAARAPLAQELAGITGRLTSLLPPRVRATNERADTATTDELVLGALRALRSRAKQAGHADIARAIMLLIEERKLTEADIKELPSLATADQWWQLAALERQMFYLTYQTQHFIEAETAASSVIGKCTDHLWCPPILRTLAGITSRGGSIDQAYELAATALGMARKVRDRKEEGRIFNVIGQIASWRLVEALDPSAVADAYLHESTLRFNNDCRTQLFRLDYKVLMALDYHRFAEAEYLLQQADQKQADCKNEGARFNAENGRARMIIHRPTPERMDQLARQVNSILTQPGLAPEHRLYSEFLIALGQLGVTYDPTTTAALRAVIEKAKEFTGDRYPRDIRSTGLGVLADRAAQHGAASEALATIAEQLDVQLEPGCAVAINHDDRVAVVVRGADNKVAAEVREVPEGQRLIPAPELLSPAMRARLVGCAHINVLATGAYFGAARLLDGDARWAYRWSRRVKSAVGFSRQVIVTDVEPPPELKFAALRSMQTGPSARVISRAEATPDGVMTAIADAEIVVINAHGITDANDPAAASLALSRDTKGTYKLTAGRVKQARFTAAPVIILAACHAGRVQVSTQPWSLASSFLSAGARAVIAPTVEIADDSANAVFESIVKRMRSGSSPEQAVAEERKARGDVPWLASVVVFQ